MKKKTKDKKRSAITGVVKIAKIKEFMKQKNLTMQEFADKCKITQNELKKVLDDYSDFEPISLLRIARAMSLEFKDLLNDN